MIFLFLFLLFFSFLKTFFFSLIILIFFFLIFIWPIFEFYLSFLHYCSAMTEISICYEIITDTSTLLWRCPLMNMFRFHLSLPSKIIGSKKNVRKLKFLYRRYINFILITERPEKIKNKHQITLKEILTPQLDLIFSKLKF